MCWSIQKKETRKGTASNVPSTAFKEERISVRFARNLKEKRRKHRVRRKTDAMDQRWWHSTWRLGGNKGSSTLSRARGHTGGRQNTVRAQRIFMPACSLHYMTLKVLTTQLECFFFSFSFQIGKRCIFIQGCGRDLEEITIGATNSL